MYKVKKNHNNSSCIVGVVRNEKSFGVILTPVVVPGLKDEERLYMQRGWRSGPVGKSIPQRGTYGWVGDKNETS